MFVGNARPSTQGLGDLGLRARSRGSAASEPGRAPDHDPAEHRLRVHTDHGRIASVLRIDHAVYAVPDLEEAAARFREDHGLDSSPAVCIRGGGRGTASCRSGPTTSSSIAIVDRGSRPTPTRAEAARDRGSRASGWFALCLADDDLDATAERLGLIGRGGLRERAPTVVWCPGGARGSRTRGATPDLPFFIAWDGPPALHPGATPIDHASGATGIAWVEVVGDAGRVRALDPPRRPTRAVRSRRTSGCQGASPCGRRWGS